MKDRVWSILKKIWAIFSLLWFLGGIILILINFYSGRPLLSEGRIGFGWIILIVLVLYIIDKERRKKKSKHTDGP